jgi:hypothetical protein
MRIESVKAILGNKGIRSAPHPWRLSGIGTTSANGAPASIANLVEFNYYERDASMRYGSKKMQQVFSV